MQKKKKNNNLISKKENIAIEFCGYIEEKIRIWVNTFDKLYPLLIKLKIQMVENG